MTSFITRLAAAASMAIAATASAPVQAGASDQVVRLQHEWERVKYQSAPANQEREFEHLALEADKAVQESPQQADVLIWRGIIVASYAGAKGGLGALTLAKNAKKDFEIAMAINPNALSGSAYTSLGSLYYQVPGWPIGFGNDQKALEYLQKGLAINPNGIDSNYFYGDFLLRSGDIDGAEQALRKALAASPRPGRQLADEGRRREINALLEKIANNRK